MEGIFFEKGIDCARFDGDVSTHKRGEELDRFREDPSCKVLLMTVQTGGVGLNITQANHIAFLDRWYNPFVHAQAEDRCHRIGQEKNVHITYFDCATTLDEVMFHINKIKKANSAIILADGTKIGNDRQNMSYRELAGVLTSKLKYYIDHRKKWLQEDGNQHKPIPPPKPEGSLD